MTSLLNNVDGLMRNAVLVALGVWSWTSTGASAQPVASDIADLFRAPHGVLYGVETGDPSVAGPFNRAVANPLPYVAALGDTLAAADGPLFGRSTLGEYVQFVATSSMEAAIQLTRLIGERGGLEARAAAIETLRPFHLQMSADADTLEIWWTQALKAAGVPPPRTPELVLLRQAAGTASHLSGSSLRALGKLDDRSLLDYSRGRYWQSGHTGRVSIEAYMRLLDGSFDPPPDPTAPAAEGTLKIAAFDADQGGPGEADDDGEFVELTYSGGAPASADGHALVFYDGETETAYFALDLSGSLTPGATYVTGNPGVAGVRATFPPGTLQNGPDAIALYRGRSAADFPSGTGLVFDDLVSAVVYEADDNVYGTTQSQRVDAPGSQGVAQSAQTAPARANAAARTPADVLRSLRDLVD